MVSALANGQHAGKWRVCWQIAGYASKPCVLVEYELWQAGGFGKHSALAKTPDAALSSYLNIIVTLTNGLPMIRHWTTASCLVFQTLLCMCLGLGIHPAINTASSQEPIPGSSSATPKTDTPKTDKSATETDAAAELLTSEQRRQATERWEDDIQAMERLDQTEADPSDAVLLVGSSSIRLWTDADQALAPYAIIRRGYGGAKFSDVCFFAERIITPHEFRAIVFFVGNDVSGGKMDHAVTDVEKWVRKVIKVARDHQPDAAILLIEVTPTPKRFDAWPKIRGLNAMLKEVALTESNTSFVSTAEFYLDRNDQPLGDLFRSDNLHQNEAGYELWASLIKRRLDEVLAPSGPATTE